jgi:tRNA (cmo5U34)-methyltransferase
MTTPLNQKSSIDEIRHRFDNDVERFSNLETGQTATIDAPLAMDLITQGAISATPNIRRVLDIGCGAGNNTLKLREAYGQDFAVDFLDLSEPMLGRAKQRLLAAHPTMSRCAIHLHQTDFRHANLEDDAYDVILAAAVLHHLRDEDDWEVAFKQIFRITAPGGSVWITDLVSHETQSVQKLMWTRYGEYLAALAGDSYRDKVFAYIDKEDSPRPVTFQMELLRKVGFKHIELLHKNSCFAAFGAIKGESHETE